MWEALRVGSGQKHLEDVHLHVNFCFLHWPFFLHVFLRIGGKWLMLAPNPGDWSLVSSTTTSSGIGFQIPSDRSLDQFVSMERVLVWEVWFKFHACFFWSLPRLIQVLTGPTSFEEELPKCPDAMDVEMVPRKGIEHQAMICEVVHDVNSITRSVKRSPIYSVEQTCHRIMGFTIIPGTPW